MDFSHYQMKAITFALYKSPVYPAIGLAGEAGEFAGKVSKLLRKSSSPNPWGSLTPEEHDALVDELGDVLWMVAACATHLNLSLGEVAVRNLKKLADRADRGVIEGSGDKR